MKTRKLFSINDILKHILMKKLLLLFFGLSTFLSSCNHDIPQPCDGKYKTAKFDEDIHTIIIKDGNGQIGIRKGEDQTFEYSKDYTPNDGFNEYSVSNGVLTIGSTFSYSYITLPSFNSVNIVEGNSTVTISTSHAEGQKSLAIGDNSGIIFGEVCGEREDAILSKTSTPLSIDAEILDNGTIDTYEVEAERVDFTVHTNGKAYFNVSKVLEGTIVSIGTVYYKGNPTTVNVDIQGSGDLIHQ